MVRFLLRTGFRRGLLGGSRAWTLVGGAALAIRALRRLSGRGEDVVYREELPAGTDLVISHQAPPARRRR